MRLTAAILFTAITASAQFTIPPFSDSSTSRVAQSFYMAQQCYSALVERCDVACFTNPAAPEVANGNRRLVEYKAALSNILVSTWWMDSTAPVSRTNRITPASLITLASLPASFWTNTPLAGASLATNGWHGLRDAIKPLIWSAKAGYKCGSELYSRASSVSFTCEPQVHYASGCSISNAEAAFYWTQYTNLPGLGTPIQGLAGGMRWVSVNPYKTFKVAYTVERWFALDFTNGAPCPGSYPPDASWTGPVIISAETNYICNTGVPSSFWTCSSGETNLLETNYEKYELLEEVTDACSTNWACDPKYTLYLQGASAGIGFGVCGANTSLTFAAEEWYYGETPTNCVTPTVAWELDSQVGIAVSNGWSNPRSYTWTNGASICVTNFAIADRMPFQGSASTSAVGWAITDAFLVQKWDASTNGFRYR